MLFKSHPNKRLINHLTEVCDLANRYDTMNDTNINKTLDIICKCHDFGKYTTFFQEHLGKGNGSDLSHHGFVSALFGSYIGLQELGKNNYLPLIIYSVIIHHHGNLDDIDESLPIDLRFDMNTIRATLKYKIESANLQLDDMCTNYKAIALELEDLGLEKYFEDFITNRPYEFILKELLKIKRKIDHGKMNFDNLYMAHQQLYSYLIDADKISASNTSLPTIKEGPYDILKKGYDTKFCKDQSKSTGVNNIRGDVFKTIQNNVIKQYNNKKYFSITAPTGTGKTLAGFFAAKQLAHLLGDNRKIIYALPFTSIIDQNYDVLVELHNQVDDFMENLSQYIIKHHHLSDTEYKTKEKDYEVDASLLLMEGWQSSIVVTTFVQLFETLIGYRNRMLKKFHSLKGSIIILDELQSVDIKYWKLIDYMLKKACEELDCRIITMTATRPIILLDSVELLDNYTDYFSSLNRVYLTFNRNAITVDEFCDCFIDNLEDKSYVIICNTIGQSIDVFNSLKNLDRPVIYLSTNIVPKERLKRIEHIKNNMEKKPIVVSTQVVEAGVDLDFDVVYRDLAPLDSIIQAAGRCNRNGEKEGQVIIIKMVRDNKLYGSYVYGRILTITEEVLEKEYYKECEFLHLIQRYFELAIKWINTNDISDKLINAVNSIKFNTLREFSLIKNRPDYVDVYFEIDEEAKKLYEIYRETVLGQRDIKEKFKAILEVKPKLQKYTLSLPINYGKEFIQADSFYRMPLEDKDRLYKDDIGFDKEALDDTIIL